METTIFDVTHTNTRHAWDRLGFALWLIQSERKKERERGREGRERERKRERAACLVRHNGPWSHTWWTSSLSAFESNILSGWCESARWLGCGCNDTFDITKLAVNGQVSAQFYLHSTEWHYSKPRLLPIKTWLLLSLACVFFTLFDNRIVP